MAEKRERTTEMSKKSTKIRNGPAWLSKLLNPSTFEDNE
jgi:hypothetical protein